MINKSKLTKKIVYDDVYWKVKQIIQPNKYDDFLLVERKNESTIHEDGKTKPVEMILLDVHNDSFGLDNKTSKEYLTTNSIKRKKELTNKMTEDWLSVCRMEEE